ncbi:MAG: PDZ domain-containing protein [Anaerolineae bacterium]|nr:PDZ domain-containing protein [Thermoflexales bacterium]MDW8407651.1 PDZ domain-containing protein [Anaerolineae bacterium]
MRTKRFVGVILSAVAGVALAIIGLLAFSSPAAAGQSSADDKGVLIVRVEADGPAARAGLQRGDIILKLADTEVNTVADINAFLANRRAGDALNVTVRRGDGERTFAVTLGNRNGRAYLGVALAADSPRGLRPEARPGLQWPKMITGTWNKTGALIVEVVPDAPAARAGLTVGEVISAVNGVTIDMTNTLSALIGRYKPGDVITLDVIGRNGQSRAMTVTLGANPDEAGKAWLGVRYTVPGPMWGRRGLPPMPRLPRLPMSVEIVVREVVTGSPAAVAGLKVDDVILSVDGVALKGPAALVDEIGQRKPGDRIALEVRRSGETLKLSVTLSEKPDKKGAAWLGVSLVARPVPPAGAENDQRGWMWPEEFFNWLPDLPGLFERLPAPQRPPLGESL